MESGNLKSLFLIQNSALLLKFKNGDLRKVNYTDYISVLKVFRQILHSNANWTNLLSQELNIDIKNLWIFRADHIKKLTVKATNSI